MSRGYSKKLVELVNRDSADHIGAALGRLCVEKSIPVIKVAATFGVSRQTVYNWFCGACAPQNLVVERIEAFIKDNS